MGRHRDINLAEEERFSPTLRQSDWIKREAQRLGVPKTEIIRRWLDEYIDRREFYVPRKGHKRDKIPVVGQERMPLSRRAA